jgi:hypothetical protein
MFAYGPDCEVAQEHPRPPSHVSHYKSQEVEAAVCCQVPEVSRFWKSYAFVAGLSKVILAATSCCNRQRLRSWMPRFSRCETVL